MLNDKSQSSILGHRHAPGSDGEQRRDLTARSYSMRASTIDDKARTVEAVLASEDPVRVFDYRSWDIIREVLVIEGMRVPAQVPMLDSHDRSSIKKQLGSTRSIRVEGGKLIGVRHFSKVADAEEAFTKIREGHLTDGSVGYKVTGWQDLKPGERAEINGRKYDNTGPDTLRISHEWTLMEDSLTPIGADQSAKVREEVTPTTTAGKSGIHARTTMDLDTLLALFPGHRDLVTKLHGEKKDAAAIRAAIDAVEGRKAADDKAIAVVDKTIAGDEAARAAELASARLQKQIVIVAESHGLRASDFFDAKTLEEATAKMVTARAEADAKANPRFPVGGTVRGTVGVEARDKFIEGVSKALLGERGGLHLSNEAIMQRCAEFDGVRNGDMSLPDLANLCVRSLEYSRGAPDKTTSSFSVLVGSVANKQLLKGFDEYTAVFDLLCTIKDAKDFNIHPNVGVATGRLTETAEGVAFPELNQREGSYNSQLKMFGATLSITDQALINDTLGEILRSFYRTGFIAARTIDRLVFNKLLNATWTNDVTASAALGTAGFFDKTRAGFKRKLSPSGETLDHDPAILLVDPIGRYAADLATGQLYGVGTGGQGMVGSNAARSLKVVDSTFVGDTGLYGSALTTDYYLFANPAAVDTVTLEFLNGQRVPMIEPFDAGAVAAVAMKVKLPFNATVATHTDSAGNARVTGIQKGQA